MKLPKPHWSVNQYKTLKRCGLQYLLFQVRGHVAPPGFALEAKKHTHRVILESDLKRRMLREAVPSDMDLLDEFRGLLEGSAGECPPDDETNEMGGVDKAIEKEFGFFRKVLDATGRWRAEVRPVAVEKELRWDWDGIPMLGYLDLVDDDRIIDLKRRKRSYSNEDAETSVQLTAYAQAEDNSLVGYATITEAVSPKLVLAHAEISPVQTMRTLANFKAAIGQVERGDFPPVDLESKDAWVCSAKYCGAWRSDARDWRTGQDISCDYGERSRVQV